MADVYEIAERTLAAHRAFLEKFRGSATYDPPTELERRAMARHVLATRGVVECATAQGKAGAALERANNGAHFALLEAQMRAESIAATDAAVRAFEASERSERAT